MNNLTQYLHETKAELQELFEDLDNEIRLAENENLLSDAYENVTSKLEDALTELETLINDIDAGVYNGIEEEEEI